LEPLQPLDFDDFRQPLNRVWGCLDFLTSPVFQPPGSELRGQAAFPELTWHSNRYGKIGAIRVSALNDRSTRLEYWPVPLPSVQEVIPFESEARNLLRDSPNRLHDLLCSVEESRQRYAGLLFDVRLEQLRQARIWLNEYLRILGLGFAHPNFTEFVFPIKGLPAQFAMLVRDITSSTTTPSGQKINCQVHKPGSLFEFGGIPTNANRLEVRFTVEKPCLEIRASNLPDGTTLLRASILAESKGWEVWGLLRDEMERLQCFSLPSIPKQEDIFLPVAPQSPDDHSTAGETPESPKPWELVDNEGDNQVLVEHWHNNLTCKEIATKLGRSEKTIINRINLLRNRYGPEIVPYRREIPKRRTT